MSDGNRAKAYQKTRNWLRIAGIGLTLFILVTAISLGLTERFYGWAQGITTTKYGMLFFYFLFFSLYSLVISFPLGFYSSYTLEHQYGLSNQTLSAWFVDWIKRELLSFGIVTPLVLLLYALIWNFESSWWLFAWAGYAIFSLVMGKLFPVLIVPLFYKYSPVSDSELKGKIERLADRFGLAIQNVYALNLSKTTKKANAAFTGLGKTKRVILSDTLLDSFTHSEIESVVAHELGHFKHRDIWKQFGLGIALSFLAFWLSFRLLNPLATHFQYSGSGDMQAFPLLCAVMFAFGLITGPMTNAFSRWVERNADLFALQATKDADSFIYAMKKLSELNLADPTPHPVIEFMFYDHPAIAKRIRFAERFKSRHQRQ